MQFAILDHAKDTQPQKVNQTLGNERVIWRERWDAN